MTEHKVLSHGHRNPLIPVGSFGISVEVWTALEELTHFNLVSSNDGFNSLRVELVPSNRTASLTLTDWMYTMRLKISPPILRHPSGFEANRSAAR